MKSRSLSSTYTASTKPRRSGVCLLLMPEIDEHKRGRKAKRARNPHDLHLPSAPSNFSGVLVSLAFPDAGPLRGEWLCMGYRLALLARYRVP